MKIWVIELQGGWRCAVPATTAGHAYKIATARLDPAKRPLAVVTHEVKPLQGEGFTATLRRAIMVVRRANQQLATRETPSAELPLVNA